MREPNFNIDWIIPNQLLGLTHFHEDILPEDIQGVMLEASKLIEDTAHPISLIIDNRLAQTKFLVPLTQLQQSAPVLRSKKVNWIMAIKPEKLEVDVNSVPLDIQNGVKLKNVSGVKEAMQFLNNVEEDYAWAELNTDFFPPLKVKEVV